MRALSWLLPKNASGWRMRYWSSGLLLATITLSEALPAPAAAPRLLPRAGYGAGISGEYRGVQVAHVHAEFHGVGRGEAEQPALEQVPFDASPVFGQVTRSVGRYALGHYRMRQLELVARVNVYEFCLSPAADEGHRSGCAA